MPNKELIIEYSCDHGFLVQKIRRTQFIIFSLLPKAHFDILITVTIFFDLVFHISWTMLFYKDIKCKL